ncbi:MAG: hypothetical protein JKY50_04260 [Oleispira sp.]|nr:hypothetical protein [Oleispira sp.]MBL4881789.1 hypothetical protein [Oleispira sp.]
MPRLADLYQERIYFWAALVITALPMTALLLGIILTELSAAQEIMKMAAVVIKVSGALASIIAVSIAAKALNTWKKSLIKDSILQNEIEMFKKLSELIKQLEINASEISQNLISYADDIQHDPKFKIDNSLINEIVSSAQKASDDNKTAFKIIASIEKSNSPHPLLKFPDSIVNQLSIIKGYLRDIECCICYLKIYIIDQKINWPIIKTGSNKDSYLCTDAEINGDLYKKIYNSIEIIEDTIKENWGYR